VSVSIFRERGSDAVRHSMQSREHADSILCLPIAEETDFSFRQIHHKMSVVVSWSAGKHIMPPALTSAIIIFIQKTDIDLFYVLIK
jgi:hypothetical protein